ncbi:hypothetical protein A2V68_00305 [candidate division Kazan bacterium RBG_13_50_9]|uniref:Uncharacterized protein n=1 Tax=candidate division Kazan bacterium RBG_13_50_9 TaxID=1798535 RepID=A0A1F4NRV2_UNCK3|nr:MAG: hypothetical protein A2V68_00305 [candidate division Kazan bacterium RBG_13_50_9]
MGRVQTLIGLALLATLSLGGCGVKTDPAVVLDRVSQAMSLTKQAAFVGQFNLSGDPEHNLFEGLSELSVRFEGRADLASLNGLQYLISLLVNGSSAEGSTRIGAEVRSFPDYNYFRITDVAIPLDLPFALTTDNKWYKVKRSSDSGANVLGSNPRLISDEEWEQVRGLIGSSRLFLTDQLLPDETVNGTRSYHLKVIIDRFALVGFLDQLDAITRGKLQLDRAAWMKLVDGYNYDLWITKRGYRLTRLKVAGTYIGDELRQVDFDLSLNLTNFDTPVEVTRPSEVEDFSLQRLFGLPLGNL